MCPLLPALAGRCGVAGRGYSAQEDRSRQHAQDPEGEDLEHKQIASRSLAVIVMPAALTISIGGGGGDVGDADADADDTRCWWWCWCRHWVAWTRLLWRAPLTWSNVLPMHQLPHTRAINSGAAFNSLARASPRSPSLSRRARRLARAGKQAPRPRRRPRRPDSSGGRR